MANNGYFEHIRLFEVLLAGAHLKCPQKTPFYLVSGISYLPFVRGIQVTVKGCCLGDCAVLS
jgi:hypothetical protein